MPERTPLSRALRQRTPFVISLAWICVAACTGYIGEPELSPSEGDSGPATGGSNTSGADANTAIRQDAGTGSGGSSSGGAGGRGGAAGDTTGGGGSGLGGAGGQGGTATGDLAHGLTISKIAVYQAVEIPIMQDGTALKTLNAPLVAGRPALVRIFVKPSGTWSARDITANLELGKARELTHAVRGASAESDLGTTFNFELTPDEVTVNTTYVVHLYEAPGAAATGPTDGSVWPATGKASFAAHNPGPFKVTVVPLSYNATGSSQLPDTSDANIKYLTDAMFSTYPTPSVDVTLHAPLPIDQKIENDGTGWGSALNKICMLRIKDKAPRNVIYYGLLAPGPFSTYCQQGCVEGLAAFSQGADDDYAKCSMGLGYPGQGAGVFEQEVAHNLGRNHAPCGNPDPVDDNYPYPGGKIGVWGYSLSKKVLVDPTKYVDFMSYCRTTWVSDYTYGALFDRIAELNQLVASLSGPLTPVAFRAISVEPNGSAGLGDVAEFTVQPHGQEREVTVTSADGTSQVVKASFYPYYPYTTGGGSFLVKESDLAGRRSVTLPNGTRLSIAY